MQRPPLPRVSLQASWGPPPPPFSPLGFNLLPWIPVFPPPLPAQPTLASQWPLLALSSQPHPHPHPPWLLSVVPEGPGLRPRGLLPGAGSCSPWKQALLCGPCWRPAAGDAEERKCALKSAGGGSQDKYTQPGEQEGWKIPQAWASLPHRGLTRGLLGGMEGRFQGGAVLYLLPPWGQAVVGGRWRGGSSPVTQGYGPPHGQRGTACDSTRLCPR